MLRSILLVDDDARDYVTLLNDFNNAGIQVHSFTCREDAEEFLKTGELVDLVVLDWHLSDDSHTNSLLFLRKLREHFFVPVLMWTGVGNPIELIEERRVFPRSLVRYHSKAEFTRDKLVDAVRGFYEDNLPGQLAREWRSVSAQAIEKTLYSLSEAGNSNILAAINGLADDDTDVSHPVSVLHQLLLRHVSQDESWRAVLGQATEGRKGAKPTKNQQEEYGNLVHLQRYYTRKPAISVRTGDVVKVIPVGWKGEPLYGVAITPSCDLAQTKTHYIRVAVIREEALVYGSKPDGDTRAGTKYDRQWLPYLIKQPGNTFAHYVCNFHDVMTLQRQTDGESWAHKKLESLRYSERYLLAGQSDLVCRIEHILTLDEPYQSAFLNRFSAHAGRIGTPDVDRSVE